MSKRQRRKQHWFETGVEALQRVTGEPAPGYVCPLCRRWYTSVDEVTFEDAPPRSVGGRPVALTCVSCNSSAGHGVDAELAKAHVVREWNRGRLSAPLRARLLFDGLPQNVWVHRSPDGLFVAGDPSINDPANTAAIDAAFARHAESEEPYREPLHFTFAGYQERHARIALLRSAYVIAFARLGYRYALRPSLEVVREQILRPDDELIDRFSLHRGEPLGTRDVVWVEAPKNLESIIVHFNDHLVFLPGMKASGPIYDRLATRKVWPPRRAVFRALRFKALGWPTRPHHLMD